MYRVSNPTSRAKAVRNAGGFAVISPGETFEMAADWTDAELGRYRAAGLDIVVKRGRPRRMEPDE